MKIYFNLKANKLIETYNYEPTFTYQFDVEITEDVSKFIDANFPFIKYESGKFVSAPTERDAEIKRFENFKRINELRQMLTNSDYKIVKCYEATMLNKPLPYDLELLVAQREVWRSEINQLEES